MVVGRPSDTRRLEAAVLLNGSVVWSNSECCVSLSSQSGVSMAGGQTQLGVTCVECPELRSLVGVLEEHIDPGLQ